MISEIFAERDIFIAGYATGLSLIMAIGAQNAFVLRQGLMRQHVWAVVLICALSDTLLIALGVFGSSKIAQVLPGFAPVMRWGGAAFLIFYGARAALSAWRGGQGLDAAQQGRTQLWKVALTCLALTWLNPHVYLDTVVLIGAISSEFAPHHTVFGIGAMSASASFFVALGFGARLLAPVFAKPAAWRVLDGLIALIMWAIAASLVRGL